MTDSFVKVQTPWGSAEMGESDDVNPAGRKTYRLFGGTIQRQDVPGGDWTPLTKREADMLLDLASGMWAMADALIEATEKTAAEERAPRK